MTRKRILIAPAYAIVATLALAGCARTADTATVARPEATPGPAQPSVYAAATGSPPAAIVPAVATDIQILYLPVGAGNCIVVKCPGKKAANPILIDCGSSGHSSTDFSQDKAAATIQKLFPAKKYKPIVILSHSDTDHHNYVPAVFPTTGKNPYALSAVWYGQDIMNYPSTIQSWITAAIAKNPSISINDTVGMNATLPANWSNGGNKVPELTCGDADTYILTVNTPGGANTSSLVLFINYGQFSATFTGDAEGSTQNAAITNYTGKKVGLLTTVMLGSHHGSDTHGSNSAAWAKATKPQVTVFSSGTKFFHPSCAAVSVYETALFKTQSHEFFCGQNSIWQAYETTAAEYVTESNGLITITADKSAKISIMCSGGEIPGTTCNLQLDGPDIARR